MNDMNAGNYMHQSTSQFGNMLQAQIKARAERERLAAEQAAKNAASAEEKAALAAAAEGQESYAGRIGKTSGYLNPKAQRSDPSLYSTDTSFD